MASTIKMSKKTTIIYVPCDPEIFGGQTSVPITLLRNKLYIPPKSKPVKVVTLGSEVDRLVIEWYTIRGLPVPPEDLIGSEIDATEAASAARLEAAALKQETVPTVVPPYGTQEFWAYHRAKRAAENKRRDEEGLPPLPTKKELEAEKIKKAAERLAKKAEKEKAVAEKAAKKAAKAPKAAKVVKGV
jgi:hypothetical protein